MNSGWFGLLMILWAIAYQFGNGNHELALAMSNLFLVAWAITRNQEKAHDPR